VAGAIGIAVLAAAAGTAGTGYADAGAWPLSAAVSTAPGERDLARLERKLAATVPSGTYIVIDRTHNQFSLRRGEETILDALCSAGSGARLVDPAGSREWVFATPRGRFEVLRKLRSPAWRRPDWSFIESGEPIPTNPADRIEYGALGEFALDFGDGYLIHGTLYERLLGRSVSHGCIRLGRDDLREVYASTRVGTPIYIY
jgi:L,D-transpeptidase YbiS